MSKHTRALLLHHSTTSKIVYPATETRMPNFSSSLATSVRKIMNLVGTDWTQTVNRVQFPSPSSCDLNEISSTNNNLWSFKDNNNAEKQLFTSEFKDTINSKLQVNEF